MTVATEHLSPSVLREPCLSKNWMSRRTINKCLTDLAIWCTRGEGAVDRNAESDIPAVASSFWLRCVPSVTGATTEQQRDTFICLSLLYPAAHAVCVCFLGVSKPLGLVLNLCAAHCQHFYTCGWITWTKITFAIVWHFLYQFPWHSNYNAL